MDRDLVIYREVLENLLDGVIVVKFDGTIAIVNEAACKIFELNRDDVVGQSFAETFIPFEGFDEFTQIVLDATTEQSENARQVSEVQIAGESRSIAITTTYLTSVRDEQTESIAVLAVFTDITEIRELRETELRLAKENESQHRNLQKAYNEIQAKNTTLSQMVKKVRVARGMSIFVFFILFFAVGSYYLQPLDPFSLRPLDTLVNAVASVVSDKDSRDVPQTAAAPDAQALQTVVVKQSPLNSTISLRGYLAPGHIVSVVSPIESHIKDLQVRSGQHVKAGDVLMELDTEIIQTEYRRAEVDYIKKLENLRSLEDWQNSAEVADAKRRHRRAKLSLENSKKQFERTNFLLEQGIIPSSQQEEAQRSYESQLLDFEAATEDLAAIKNKAGADQRRVAALEVENSRSQLKKLEDKLTMSTITTPIAGVIQQPPVGPEQKPLNVGRPLKQGELLVTVANFDQISVSTSVDEVDVGKIESGQAAWITGPGFPDLRLEGAVTQVASRATRAQFGRSGPKFEIKVELDGLSEAHRDVLRAGMSAHVTIVVYDQPEALLIPIATVEQQNNETFVQVVNEQTGEIERRSVKLGLTTLQSVEVIEGIKGGEKIVIPEA